MYSSLYVDIHGPSMQAGALIHQWTFHTDTTELWEIEPYSLNSDYYTIRSLYSNLYLGVTAININTDNVVQTIVADPDGIAHTDATLWRIYENDSGQFALFPKSGESYMNVLTAPSSLNGDELIQTEYMDMNSQYWVIERQDGVNDAFVHTIINSSNNRFMKIKPATAGGSLHISQYSHNEPTLMWRFEENGSGYYFIKNEITNEYLKLPINSVDGSTVEPAQYVPSTDDTYIDQFLWNISKQSDNGYTIQNKNHIGSSLYLSISNGFYVSKTYDVTSCWIIKPLRMKINVLYDQAFAERFGSNYMTVLHNTFGENSVGKSFESVYRDVFGVIVEITFTNTTTISNPYTQNCEHKNQINEYCHDCKDQSAIVATENDVNKLFQDCENGLHHKRETSFIPETTSLHNSTQINILFTGHVGCQGYINEDGVIIHDDTMAHGWSYIGDNGIAIFAETHSENIENNIYDQIIRTLTHESLHLLNTPHCEEVPCIMGDVSSNVEKYLTMCSSCLNTAKLNRISLYNH